MKEDTTIEQKLYQAHELLGEVLPCLDLNSPLYNELFSAQNIIFLVGRNLPRNILSYKPRIVKK
jgi:hypothetical protein